LKLRVKARPAASDSPSFSIVLDQEEKIMKIARLVLAVALLMGPGVVGMAQAANPAPAVQKGDKPASSPGWIVIEEDWWYPLRLDPFDALEDARFHYRRGEEMAAAHDVHKAAAWLRFAENHALPETQKKLADAAADLSTLSADLESGKVGAAERLEGSLARASEALAEWHYFQARDHLGKLEAGYAAEDLEAAAEHLQLAANSAHHEFGPDTMTVFDRVRENGLAVTEAKTIDLDVLGKDLDAIQKAVQEMDETLKKASK
jgi:hypothetical protein